MNPISIIWRHIHVLWATTLTDIRSRFIGTIFGVAWIFLYPLLFLGLYAVVYTMIYRVRVAEFGTFDYVLLIFCGLVPFLGFSEALGSGVGSVLGNKGLIKNTLFPIDLIPVKTVLASSVTMLVGLVMLLMVLWSRGIVHSTQLAIPLILVLQIIFTVGLIWILSAINVFVPDLSQMVAVLILFLMLVSPIAYTQEMIPKELIPFMYPNPLYYLIMLYRDAAFIGVIKPGLLAIFTVISFSTFFLGGFVFSRLKPLFADYV
ncbi:MULTISPECIES: ABC transporter permease [Pseudomonas]|jgi:lipopolysaccharide transport system permease protein|uniref:Transport permease protein n=3 Tax=Pseudomonas TaxID=286 RepID=A0A0G3G9W7_9PSED|nr:MULTISPECIES: ABC transporter permease [Pseudomonas]AKJ98020.1 ABC transporter [Pseudomonas chlororaphis]AUM71937.1 ABC transporter [Pseudomonas fluorescens]KIQ60810.1 ABC transporter [Pseudomonas fluorescens]PJH86462.1 ABC transporter [Pseudomonas sp. WCS365]ROM78723.1 ABC transporter [Pseudomonas brassicacearum]